MIRYWLIVLAVLAVVGVAVALIAVVAIVVRLAVLVVPFDFSGPDSVTYLEPAAALARGEGYLDAAGRPTAARPPGYPAFVAACYRLAGGESFVAVRVAQALLGGAATLLVHAALRGAGASATVALAGAALLAWRQYRRLPQAGRPEYGTGSAARRPSWCSSGRRRPSVGPDVRPSRAPGVGSRPVRGRPSPSPCAAPVRPAGSRSRASEARRAGRPRSRSSWPSASAWSARP